MRSIDQLANPASSTIPAISCTESPRWVRPRSMSTGDDVDWIPTLTLVTPIATSWVSFSPVTSSGFISRVISLPGARSSALRTCATWSAWSREGVPPPKNTLVAGLGCGVAAISATTAST